MSVSPVRDPDLFKGSEHDLLSNMSTDTRVRQGWAILTKNQFPNLQMGTISSTTELCEKLIQFIHIKIPDKVKQQMT